MIYVPEDYSNYKYLVAVHDNYITLSNDNSVSGSLDSPDSISVIHQYFSPSIYTINDTMVYYSSEHFSNISSDLSSSVFDRGDFCSLFICNFIVIVMFAFILNQLTKLVKKRWCIWL